MAKKEIKTALNLEPIKQDQLAATFGKKKARQACLPTCFFILGKGYGYIDSQMDIQDFVKRLDWKNNFNEKLGWLRPKLSNELRKTYGMQVISWQLLQKSVPSLLNKRRMKKAGYFGSRREWNYFKKHIANRDILSQLRSGHPLIVSVLPGFGGNKDVHSVVLYGIENGKVKVIDPDTNNSIDTYDEQVIRKYISPLGAATVVLPK